MSERGSFVTQYIYCQDCLVKVRQVFCQDRSKHLCATQIVAWEGSESPVLPIVAGKLSSSFDGGEIQEMEDYLDSLRELGPCHRLMVSVICDSGKAATYLIEDGQVAQVSVTGSSEVVRAAKTEAEAFVAGSRQGALQALHRIRNDVALAIQNYEPKEAV